MLGMNASNRAFGRAFDGALEGIDGGVAVGWARDPHEPQARLAVEILADGYPVALDRADIFRPELPGDGCHGFAIAVPRHVLDRARELSASVANAALRLGPALRLGDARPAARPGIAGEVSGRGLRLAGWVARLDHRMEPLRVVACEGQLPLAETCADLPLPSDGRSPSPPRARGFALHLPMALADGRLHLVRVTDGDGRDLKGSPLPVVVWPEGPAGVLRVAAAGSCRDRIEAVAQLLDSPPAAAFASVGFFDHAAWMRAFPPTSAAAMPAGVVTAVIHGSGDADATEAALAREAGVVRILRAPGGTIDAGDWPSAGLVALLGAGDGIVPGAIARLAAAMEGADIAYADGEQMVGGVRQPWLRPDWDPDLMLAQGYVFGLLMFRGAPVGGDGPVDLADLVLDALATAPPGRIAHLPEVLHLGAEAPAPGAAPTPPGWSAERAAARWPAARSGGAVATPLPGTPWLARIRWPVPSPAPSVEVLIPTRDRVDLLRPAVESLLDVTDYPKLGVTVLDNGSAEPETLAYLAALGGRGIGVRSCPGPFNFSRIMNLGAAASTADVLCLLNNDVEITEPGWLAEMVGLLMRPDTGVVGAKLLWRTGIVQHGGVVLGIDGGAVHAGNSWAAEDAGHAGCNLVTRRVSAVTGACLVLRRSDYLAVGGLDEEAFAVNFNDVDLCLKVQERGRAVVWTPFASLLHHESASRGADELPERAARSRRELAKLRERWAGRIARDPYYNPNLNRDAEPFAGLALPPAPRSVGR